MFWGRTPRASLSTATGGRWVNNLIRFQKYFEIVVPESAYKLSTERALPVVVATKIRGNLYAKSIMGVYVHVGAA